MYSTMFWDVIYDVLRCIESKYIIQYIAIHLWIHHNTSGNIDVLGCVQLSKHDQYTTIPCSIHLQYMISNTSYLHQTSVWNTSINRCVIHSQHSPDTFEIQSKYISSSLQKSCLVLPFHGCPHPPGSHTHGLLMPKTGCPDDILRLSLYMIWDHFIVQGLNTTDCHHPCPHLNNIFCLTRNWTANFLSRPLFVSPILIYNAAPHEELQCSTTLTWHGVWSSLHTYSSRVDMRTHLNLYLEPSSARRMNEKAWRHFPYHTFDGSGWNVSASAPGGQKNTKSMQLKSWKRLDWNGATYTRWQPSCFLCPMLTPSWRAIIPLCTSRVSNFEEDCIHMRM